MPPVASLAVRQALVSLWRKPDSFALDDFVCSGFFVAPATVLTVGHAPKDVPALWVTAYGSPNSYPVRHAQCHPELDVALLTIESVPPDAGVLPCNRSLHYQALPPPLTLNGFFEGRLESPQELAVLRFSEQDRHYLTQLKQPRGQSGSPVCTGDDQVWALAVRHYSDANILRGALVAVHQFAPWLDTLLPPGAVPAARPAQPPALQAPDDAPAAAAVLASTEAALAQTGLDDSAAPVIVSACIVSDAPLRLAGEIDEWKARALGDPLLPAATRQRARKADLPGLLREAALRPRLLERLSVTSFSAYVHYATRAQLVAAGIAEVDWPRRFLVELLVQRLRKRSERLLVVRGDSPDIAEIVARAAERARRERPDGPDTPQALSAAAPGNRAMLELAHLAAQAVAGHLAAPLDEEATTLFEHLRTRIRFAMNVATRERHTRDRNPLP